MACKKISLGTYLKRIQTGAMSPAVPGTIINYGDVRLTYAGNNAVIVIPQYANFSGVIVNIASLGVPLKPADYAFNKVTGTITINNYYLNNGDAVYLIPAN